MTFKSVSVGCFLFVFHAACGSVVKEGPDGAPAQAPDAAPQAPDAAPVAISAVSPGEGIVGVTVTIEGTGFGADQGEGTVELGGVTATVESWSEGAIEVTVPDVFPGRSDLTVTSDGATSASSTFRVILPPAVYVNNDDEDPEDGFSTLSAMSFDPETGELSSMSGSPMSLGVGASSFGGCSFSAVLHEETRRLFVTSSGMVSVFDIDPTTGELTAVSGSPFPTGGGSRAFGMTVNQDGTRLFVANGSMDVLAIAADGSLSPIEGSPFEASGGIDVPILLVEDQYLYVNNESGSMLAYSVAGDGALSPLEASPLATGTNAFTARKRPGHPQVFIPDAAGVVAVTADEASGEPAVHESSPFAVADTVGTSGSLGFTPDGNRLYVASFNSSSLEGFDVAADGALTSIGAAEIDPSSSTGITCTHASRDGQYFLALYGGTGEVGVFAFDGDGIPGMVGDGAFDPGAPAARASGMAVTF